MTSDGPIDMETLRDAFAPFVRQELSEGHSADVDALGSSAPSCRNCVPVLRELSPLPIFDVRIYALS
jgi:hypothetical protein